MREREKELRDTKHVLKNLHLRSPKNIWNTVTMAMSVMETNKTVAVFYISTPLYSVKCLGYLSRRFSSEIFQCFEIVLVEDL